MTKGVKGTGVSSPVQTPNHPIKSHGHWWRSQEDLQRYKDRENLRKRMKRAGVDNLEEMARLERHVRAPIQLSRLIDKMVKEKLTSIRTKYNLPETTNRLKLQTLAQQTRDPEILELLGLQASMKMNDIQRVARIREIFNEGGAAPELLFKIATVVGVEVRKRS